MATFSFQIGSGSPGQAMGLGRKIVMLLFFGFFLFMGLLFTAFMASSSWKSLQPYRWTKTPCLITASASERGRVEVAPYGFWVEYRYEAAGRELTSHACTASEQGYSDYTEVQHLLLKYSAGARAFCYVDPADPTRAVLERSSPFTALVVLFPLIFVAVGGGGIYFLLRPPSPRADSTTSTGPSISQVAQGRLRTAGLSLFFSLFLLAGLGMLYPLAIRPIAQTISARQWRETPCTVVSGEVRSHESDDGTTYSVDILYEYEVGGVAFRSNRYTFVPGSSSGYEPKRAIVDRYLTGSRAVCYVSPRDPAEAVLMRGFTWGLLFALFPLVFVAVGGGGMYYVLRSALPKTAPAEALAATPEPPSELARGLPPRDLKPSASPVAKLLGFLLMALFWNGITWVVGWQAVQTWRRGHPDIFLSLFISIFLLAGLGLVLAVLYHFLALFNPRLHLTLQEEALRLGEPADLRWSLSGGARKVRALRMVLEGREEAVYQNGKSTSTAKSAFFTQELLNTSADSGATSGVVRITIPPSSMHSFKADHNRVVWAVKVTGEIPEWPDLDEEFPLEVLPPGAGWKAGGQG